MRKAHPLGPPQAAAVLKTANRCVSCDFSSVAKYEMTSYFYSCYIFQDKENGMTEKKREKAPAKKKNSFKKKKETAHALNNEVLMEIADEPSRKVSVRLHEVQKNSILHFVHVK